MAVEEIKSIFRQSMEDLGIHELSAKDEKGEPLDGLKLFAMANESFWLPRLALRANEISQFLFNGSCFDVVFKYDSKNASGIAIEEPSESIKSEYGYPMFSAPVSDTLKRKIATLALKQSISFDNEFVSLKDNLGMYEYNEGDKYLRPLEPSTSLVVSMWMSKLPDLNRAHELSVKPELNDEMSL